MEETYERFLIKKASLNHISLTTTLELTPLCNMNCDMCYVRLSKAEMSERGQKLDVEEWITIAKQMAEHGTLFVLLTGGEPLLFPDFRKLYLELKKLGMIISINTNGTLINEEWASFFGNHKPRRINITLYGSSDMTYAKLCHYPEGFQKTIQGIRLLKENGVDVKLNASMTKANKEDFDDIYHIGEELEIPVSTDTYMLPGRKERMKHFRNQSRLEPEDAAFMQWKVLQNDMSPDTLRQYVQYVLEQIEKNRQDYPKGICCQASFSSCAVDWQGMLRPCVTLEDPGIDLRKHSFKEAWEELSSQARLLYTNEKCSTCSLRPICQTCAGSARIETGYYDGIPEYLCAYSEELFRLFQKEGEKWKNETDI